MATEAVSKENMETNEKEQEPADQPQNPIEKSLPLAEPKPESLNTVNVKIKLEKQEDGGNCSHDMPAPKSNFIFLDKTTHMRSTTRQRTYLINYMSKDFNLANANFTCTLTRQLYVVKWTQLCIELNNLGPPKSIPQWQHVWRDIKSRYRKEKRKKLAAGCPHQVEQPQPDNRQVQPERNGDCGSPPPSPPEAVPPCQANQKIETMFEEARDAFLQISSQQSNMLERFLTFFDNAESRRREVEDKRVELEERRLRIEERMLTMLEELGSVKKN